MSAIDPRDHPFVHTLVPPPEGTIPPAFTITGTFERSPVARLVERLDGRSFGHVIHCSACRQSFGGDTNVRAHYEAYERHECEATA